MAGPKCEHGRSGLGFAKYSMFPAPVMTAELILEVPTRSGRSGWDLQNGVRGPSRRRKKWSIVQSRALSAHVRARLNKRPRPASSAACKARGHVWVSAPGYTLAQVRSETDGPRRLRMRPAVPAWASGRTKGGRSIGRRPCRASPVAQEDFLCRPLDLVIVKGRSHPTEIFELVALKGAVAGTDQDALPSCGSVGSLRYMACARPGLSSASSIFSRNGASNMAFVARSRAASALIADLSSERPRGRRPRTCLREHRPRTQGGEPPRLCNTGPRPRASDGAHVPQYRATHCAARALADIKLLRARVPGTRPSRPFAMAPQLMVAPTPSGGWRSAGPTRGSPRGGREVWSAIAAGAPRRTAAAVASAFFGGGAGVAAGRHCQRHGGGERAHPRLASSPPSTF